MFYKLIVILILIVCAVLAIFVLIQNSKGGGLAAGISGPNEIMGVRKTADFLEKATWTLAIALMVLSIIATAAIPNRQSKEALSTDVTVNETALPQPTPNAPLATEAAAEAPVAE